LLKASEPSPPSTQALDKSESSQEIVVVQTEPKLTNSILEDLLNGDIQVEDVPKEHQVALLNYLGSKIQKEVLYS